MAKKVKNFTKRFGIDSKHMVDLSLVLFSRDCALRFLLKDSGGTSVGVKILHSSGLMRLCHFLAHDR